jgi:hypothetical protein
MLLYTKIWASRASVGFRGVAVGKDVLGIKAVNQLDIDGLFTPGTVVVDYLGTPSEVKVPTPSAPKE